MGKSNHDLPSLINIVIQSVKLACCYAYTTDIWASSQEPLSSGFANNKGADQPALFSFWKVSYLDLLRAKFQFSS